MSSGSPYAGFTLINGVTYSQGGTHLHHVSNDKELIRMIGAELAYTVHNCDYLWFTYDPAVRCSMGDTAENLAKTYGITREAVDAFASRSFERAMAGLHFIAGEVVEVVVAVFSVKHLVKHQHVETGEAEKMQNHGQREQRQQAAMKDPGSRIQ